jgi:hypothetical protein
MWVRVPPVLFAVDKSPTIIYTIIGTCNGKLMLNTRVLETIVDKIHQHHQLYRFPLKAELWEDIFDQAINDSNKRWKMGSHAVGADVVSDEGIRYQLKGGMIDVSKDTVEWSGSRTTQYKTIQEKINFISDKHCDMYALLARNKKEWNRGLQKYYLLMFDANLINYSKLNWEERSNGWSGANVELQYSAEIHKSMSHQLWTRASLSYLGKPKIITVTNDTKFFEYKK